MLVLAFKNFIRSNGVKIGLLFLLLAGIVSLFVGKQFIEKQKRSITETSIYQKEYIERNTKIHKDEIGLLLYYLKFSLVNTTLPLNSLSIGQRDINPSIQSVTIRGLEAQKYDSDLNNPSNLLLGNIDLSIVLIYLFPLLIIAFTYNIISEEKESGTWKIVSIQSKNAFLHILKLFYIRGLIIISVFLVTLVLAIIFLGIPLDRAFYMFTGTAILYLFFWFSVCFCITSLQKNSNPNAVILLAIWIVLVIILPATVNNFLINKYPVPEALETTIKQRKGYHEKWDMDKKVTMDKFYTHYPQFKTYPLPNKEFSWLWYYAMQQMGDDDASKQTKELRAKLEQRNVASIDIARFVPTLHTQIQLNEIVKSGLGNQLQFMDNTSKFHEKLRLYFYPKIFSEAPVVAEKWEKFKVETFTENSPFSYIKLFIPLCLFIVFLVSMGCINFRRNV